MASNLIERIIYRMHKTEKVAFIGTTLQCMTINISSIVPTAGVLFNKKIKQFELYVNEDWFAALPRDEERMAVMVHELNHIFFKHVFIPQEIVLSKNKTKLNISMDLVINQFIDDLPKDCFTIEKIKDKDGKLLPPNQTFEEYYNLLDDATMEVPDCSMDPGDHQSYQKGQSGGQNKSDQKGNAANEKSEGSGDGSEQSQDAKDGQGSGQKYTHKEYNDHTGHNCDGSCKGKNGDKKPGKKGTRTVKVSDYYEEKPFDDHQWSDAEQQEALEAARDLIKRSMQKAAFSGTKVPGHIEEVLENINATLNGLNYKALLMKALKQSLPSKDTRKTWKRPSRRLGDIAQGNMVGLMPKLHVHIDTSGSISIPEANEFLAITNNFMTVGVSKADLFLWHTQIYHKEKIKKNFAIKPDTFQMGGTDLQPSIDIINKQKPDLAIILTDGYYGEVNLPKGFNTPLVFVISRGGDIKHSLHNKPHVTTVKYSE